MNLLATTFYKGIRDSCSLRAFMSLSNTIYIIDLFYDHGLPDCCRYLLIRMTYFLFNMTNHRVYLTIVHRCVKVFNGMVYSSKRAGPLIDVAEFQKIGLFHKPKKF